LLGGDPLSYKEISEALRMPIGSIGPTRGRCLEHLGRIMEELETVGLKSGANQRFPTAMSHLSDQ
jgi:DNA-directed RNA polymerase specialized sigma24 family protein